MKRALGILAIVVLTFTAGVTLTQPADAQTKPTMGERVDDAQITAKVKSKLVAEHPSALVKVNVDTSDGVVRLSGIVPTEADRTNAERIAAATSGVKTVMNDLKTETGGSASPRQ